MIQIKSFKIEEGEEISKFLETHILHGKSSILVSEGKLAIPYEDGRLPTKEQLIANVYEDIILFQDQMAPLVHSNRVNEVTLSGIDTQITEHEATLIPTPQTKEEIKINNAAQKEIKRLKEVVRPQYESQILMNKAEITRMATNIAVYQETITILQSE